MHSAWTRGRISSLHCQLDTAPWIKLLFFRLLEMLYREKYVSASKAFSKWRQSIKPARKKHSLVMVTFCSLTVFASTVIRGEEWGFHMHTGKADSISTLLVLQKSREFQQCQRNLCWQTEQLPLCRTGWGGQWAPRAAESQSALLLSPLPWAFLIFSSRKQHSVLSGAAHVSHHRVIFFVFPRKYYHWCN